MAIKKQTKPVELEQMFKYLPLLKKHKKSLPHIKFDKKSDIKFTKWDSMTENIIVACFGRGSNQHDQYTGMVRKLTTDESLDFSLYNWSSNTFKTKMTNLLGNFISELELLVPASSKRPRGISMKMSNTQTVNQLLDLNIVVNSVIEDVKANEPDSNRVAEAEKALRQFGLDMNKEKPEWSKIKNALIWALGFSKDVFLQLVPIVMQKYL